MPDGFFGRVLWADLSRGTIEERSLSPALYKDYLGGYGLGVRMLYEWMPPGADPLGAGNVLGFVPGLLTGTGVPFSGRFMVVGKSPLTGGWGDANCGGHFGPVLRSAGYDGLFVTGVSPQPVYLFIDEGKPELRDASHLWGLDTVETDRRIKEETGSAVRAVCIGPAGEKQSLISAIITDGGRAAARSGLGAVMGAKRLKAVAVRGGKRTAIPIHDKPALSRLSGDYRQLFKGETPSSFRLFIRLTTLVLPLLRLLRVRVSSTSTDMVINAYREYGTCSGTAFATEIGDAPVKNWLGTAARDFPLRRSVRISDDAVIQHSVKRYGCRHCPIGCGGIVRLQGERYNVEESHKPEYETLAAFGPLLLNDDLESIIQINDICDRYGLDTISAGGIVAFAIECYERGLIGPEETGGLELSWGNAPAIVELMQKIARREGIGDFLADGVKRAAERIGGESEPCAVHAGGQELPMHDSRYEPMLGLAYLVDPTPGRHTVANGGAYDVPSLQETYAAADLDLPGQYEYQAKGAVFALLNRHIQVVNCAGLCLFSLVMGQPPVRGWINAVTGWEMSHADLLRVGHRIQVLRHAFNLREGIRPGDFSLPSRAVGSPPLEAGPLKGVTLDMETMIRDYFQAMGYEESTGIPTAELLESLGLQEIVGDLVT